MSFLFVFRIRVEKKEVEFLEEERLAVQSGGMKDIGKGSAESGNSET